MIELRRPTDGSSGISVFVNEVELEPRYTRISSNSAGIRVDIRRNAWEPIRSQRLSDVPSDITEIRFDPRLKRLPDMRMVPIFLWREGGNVTFTFRAAFNVHSWKRPWSMGEVRSEVRTLVRESSSKITWDDSSPVVSLLSFSIAVRDFDYTATFGELIDQWSSEAESIIKEAERRLASQLKSDSLVALFDFPREVRASCEQYLMCFVDFLKTLGIEAQSDITHDAGRALFSVTPDTGVEALAHIKEALEIYLELPLAQSLGDLTLIHDPRVQQLQANVDHLKAQLNFANAILQLKDATIHQLNVAVRSSAITPEVLQSSLRLMASSEENEDEEFFEGAVKLRKYEGKGFQIDLPKIFRHFKQRLFGDPEKTRDLPALPDEPREE